MDLLKDHLKRLSWPIAGLLISALMALFVGISRGNFEVIIFKFLVFCPALCLVHLARKTLFPYIDLEHIIDQSSDVADAGIILGVFAFYIGMTYIITAVL